jgi:hypothetical protein
MLLVQEKAKKHKKEKHSKKDRRKHEDLGSGESNQAGGSCGCVDVLFIEGLHTHGCQLVMLCMPLPLTLRTDSEPSGSGPEDAWMQQQQQAGSDSPGSPAAAGGQQQQKAAGAQREDWMTVPMARSGVPQDAGATAAAAAAKKKQQQEEQQAKSGVSFLKAGGGRGVQCCSCTH